MLVKVSNRESVNKVMLKSTSLWSGPSLMPHTQSKTVKSSFLEDVSSSYFCAKLTGPCAMLLL